MDDKKYATLSQRFRVSYMSNAKWRKFFAVFDQHDFFYNATLKFINDDRVIDYPLEKGLGFDTDSLPDGRTAPVEYKWIEWIRIPRVYKRLRDNVPFERSQDLVVLANALQGAGDFMIDEDADSMTVFGYKS